MNKNEFIETYYRENYKERLKFARKRVGGYNLALAEEAVQEAFARALRYFSTYDAEEDFDKWFGKILVNCINDIKRIEGDSGVSRDEFSNDYIANIHFNKEVVELFEKETPRNQEILNMYFFYGYKSREVAEFMHISHDSVRDIIRTFRKRVRSG